MKTIVAQTNTRSQGCPHYCTGASPHRSARAPGNLPRSKWLGAKVRGVAPMVLSALLMAGTLFLPVHADGAPKGRTGTFNILAYPEVVDVYVDGEFKGNTPFPRPLSLSVGEHTFKVTARGYTEYKSTFTITRGRNTTIEVDLLPIAGILIINTDNNIPAQVFIDGEPMGGTPFNMDIPVGERTITVKADGYREYRETLSIEALKEYDYSINLIPAHLAGGKGPESRYPHEMPPEGSGRGYPYGHDGPLLQQWWFWTAAGAFTLSAAIISTGIMLSNRPEVIEADTAINMYFK